MTKSKGKRKIIRGSPDERFWAKVVKTDTCWLWTGAQTSQGYGNFWLAGKIYLQAHHFAWISVGRKFISGLEFHHKDICRNKLCVNPDHLEQITPQLHGQFHSIEGNEIRWRKK